MIQEYKNYLQNIKGYSALTVANYCRDIREFTRWAKANMSDARWSAITRENIDAYVTYRAERGNKPATTNRALSAISSYYKYMQREGYAVENPCRYESRRKVAATMPNTIPYADLERAYENSTGAVRFMLGLLCTTAMRIGEVLAMEWEDIDFEQRTIKVHGKGAKERVVVTLDEVLYDAKMAAAASPKHGKMWRISQRTARQMIYDVLKQHTNAKQKSPHAIRHTVATRLAQNGVPTMTIAKVLGHESTETTQRYINAAAIDATAALTNNSIL